MKARIELDEHYTLSLALQCPSCGSWEHTAPHTAFSGKEFTCDCGEEIRISAASLTPVRKELQSLHDLFSGEFDLPV